MSIFGEDFYCPRCGSIKNFEFEGFDYECLECGRIFYPPGNIKNGNHYLGLSQVKHSDLPDLPGGETLNGDPRIGGQDLDEWFSLSKIVPASCDTVRRDDIARDRRAIKAEMADIWDGVRGRTDWRRRAWSGNPNPVPDLAWTMCELEWIGVVLIEFLRQSISVLDLPEVIDMRLRGHRLRRVGDLAIINESHILKKFDIGPTTMDKVREAFVAANVFPAGLFGEPPSVKEALYAPDYAIRNGVDAMTAFILAYDERFPKSGGDRAPTPGGRPVSAAPEPETDSETDFDPPPRSKPAPRLKPKPKPLPAPAPIPVVRKPVIFGDRGLPELIKRLKDGFSEAGVVVPEAGEEWWWEKIQAALGKFSVADRRLETMTRLKYSLYRSSDNGAPRRGTRSWEDVGEMHGVGIEEVARGVDAALRMISEHVRAEVAREKETEERSPEGIPCGYCRKGWMTEEPVNEEEVRREAASIRMFGGRPLLSPGDRLFVCSKRCGYVRVMRKEKA